MIPHQVRGIPALEGILEKAGLQAEQVGYVGDDFTDVVVMHRVGLGIATANARPEVKAETHWVTTKPGGHGALRGVVELLPMPRVAGKRSFATTKSVKGTRLERPERKR